MLLSEFMFCFFSFFFPLFPWERVGFSQKKGFKIESFAGSWRGRNERS